MPSCPTCLMSSHGRPHTRCKDRLHCNCCGVVKIKSTVQPEAERHHDSKMRGRYTPATIGPGIVNEQTATEFRCRTCGEMKPLANWPAAFDHRRGYRRYVLDCRDCYRKADLARFHASKHSNVTAVT